MGRRFAPPAIQFLTRVGTVISMILEFDHRGAISLETDNVTAAYDCSEVLSDVTASGSSQTASPVRLVLDLKRNLGGMRMRALIGAEFRSGHAPFGYQVCVMGRPFLPGLPATCDSRLGAPLIPGMPADFAAAALRGVRKDAPEFPLPDGLLRVDRAAHDLMGSSEVAFEQAARLLRIAFWATAEGSDVDTALSDAYERLSCRSRMRDERAWTRPSDVRPGTATAEQVELMRQLAAGTLPAPEFATAWLSARRRALDDGDRLLAAFDRILTDVFYLLDDYVIDPALRDPDDMTDEELTRRVRTALEKLDTATRDT